MVFDWLSRKVQEDLLVDDQISGRRMEYLHQTKPKSGERGILRVYDANGDIEFEFFDRHRPVPKKTGQFTRALEEVVVYTGPGETERFSKVGKDPFEFIDSQGKTFRSTAHDPVELAIVNQATARYKALGETYKTLVEQVATVAKGRVSTKGL